MIAIVQLTSPEGETFYLCYDHPGRTKAPEKATRYASLAVAQRAALSRLHGDPRAFWECERRSAKMQAERMRGWKAIAKPVG